MLIRAQSLILFQSRAIQQSLTRLCSNDSCCPVPEKPSLHHQNLKNNTDVAGLQRIPALPNLILPKRSLKLHLINHKRLFSISSQLLRNKGAENELTQQEEASTEEDIDEENSLEEDDEQMEEGKFIEKYYDPKDRTRKISPDLSIKYMESAAYRATYGDDPVWKHHRRNMKGGSQWIPKTRERCIRGGRINISSPCPICRDMYLVVDYRNTKLLDQFIDKYSGEVYDTSKTGVCQDQMERLLIQIEKAKDFGLLDLDAVQVYYNENVYKH